MIENDRLGYYYPALQSGDVKFFWNFALPHTLVAVMKPDCSQIEQFLSKQGIAFRAMSSADAERVAQDWLAQFASAVKRETGTWIHGGFRWHGFSYGLQPATQGPDAVAVYHDQWQAPYVVFDEGNTWGYACAPSPYPDLTSLNADIYVAHHNMKWTMAFTHEQPDIGPFFAKGPAQQG